MRIARTLEAVEGEETARGRIRRGTTQARFTWEEGSDTEATRITEQTLAKLWPDLRQSREPRLCPPTPGPRCVLAY